jgi:phosphoadenosine phosphosulfate reductase
MGLDPAVTESTAAEDVIAAVVERFTPGVMMACSFQKEESVLLDMIERAGADVAVFAIDTGVLFAETRATWRAFEARFGITITSVDASDAQNWTSERCCEAAKVAALKRALGGATAWITGLRRDQSPTRVGIGKLELDSAKGIWKASPLADWTAGMVWERIHERNLPYNPLHDRGYASIGCAPCTVPGEGREGRWAGTSKTECGIHVADGRAQ